MKTLMGFALEMPLKIWMLMVGIQQLDAIQVTCLVTENETGRLYSMPENEGHNCTCTWTNATDHVLAFVSEDNKKYLDLKQVVQVTIRTLLMSRPLTPVYYRRTCHPDGIETTATCTSDYPVIRPPKGDEGVSDWWWWWWVLLLVLLVLLVLVALALLAFFVRRNQDAKPHAAVNGSDAEGGNTESFL